MSLTPSDKSLSTTGTGNHMMSVWDKRTSKEVGRLSISKDTDMERLSMGEDFQLIMITREQDNQDDKEPVLESTNLHAESLGDFIKRFKKEPEPNNNTHLSGGISFQESEERSCKIVNYSESICEMGNGEKEPILESTNVHSESLGDFIKGFKKVPEPNNNTDLSSEGLLNKSPWSQGNVTTSPFIVRPSQWVKQFRSPEKNSRSNMSCRGDCIKTQSLNLNPKIEDSSQPETVFSNVSLHSFKFSEPDAVATKFCLEKPEFIFSEPENVDDVLPLKNIRSNVLKTLTDPASSTMAPPVFRFCKPATITSKPGQISSSFCFRKPVTVMKKVRIKVRNDLFKVSSSRLNSTSSVLNHPSSLLNVSAPSASCSINSRPISPPGFLQDCLQRLRTKIADEKALKNNTENSSTFDLKRITENRFLAADQPFPFNLKRNAENSCFAAKAIPNRAEKTSCFSPKTSGKDQPFRFNFGDLKLKFSTEVTSQDSQSTEVPVVFEMETPSNITHTQPSQTFKFGGTRIKSEEINKGCEELARMKGEKGGKKEDLLLKRVGERHTGVLVYWMDTYGFIKFDHLRTSIFVHISDIRRSGSVFVTVRMRLEFVVGFDEKKRKAKAISARVLQLQC